MKQSEGLNPKQKKFVAEYVLTLNATQSAITAGYSARTAKSQGQRLLTHDDVAAAIERARHALEIRSEITQERVLAELALLAFSDITHYEVDDAGNVKASATAPKYAMRAVSSIKRKTFTSKDGVSREVEIKLWDKPGPLKLAGRHVGLFPDRVEIAQAEDKPLAIIVSGVMQVPPELAGAVGAAIGGAAASVVVGAETTTTMDQE